MALAACSSTPKAGKNKFDPKKYGVKGSPRIVAKGAPVPKGGGRYVVGKPYKIAGKWYRPHLDSDYDKVGRASWYGPTFHGRQTANGEVFDMNALSAAHTTMPLPSYARVTNTANGRSVIVRVNDRGPFHGNREIDLSQRTAELLDFKNHGTANVRVQYVGKARLDGRDSSYLMASYRGPGESNTMFAKLEHDPVVHGPAPIPVARPYIAPSELVQVAFDPAVAFSEAPTKLAFAAEPAPLQTARSFAPTPATAASAAPFPGYISGGDQSTGFEPVSFTPAAPAPGNGILGTLPRPPGALSSFSPSKRVDAAYEAFGDISGGLTLTMVAENRN